VKLPKYGHEQEDVNIMHCLNIALCLQALNWTVAFTIRYTKRL